MTAEQILSRAYSATFGIETSEDSSYGEQRYAGIEIDYARFHTVAPVTYDMDSDWFTATVEDGCEGVYAGVFCHHKDKPAATRVGTIKTLDEGLDAWRTMGALCGELLYRAAMAAFELDAAESAAE